jgi:starch phosphorylase
MELNNFSKFQYAIKQYLRYRLGKLWEEATADDLFKALALTLKDVLIDGMLETERRYAVANAKRLYYLSMEFLMGRALGNTLCNLGLLDRCERSLRDLGIDLDEVRASEADAALGNGGLGRLAAGFLDSLATLAMPGFGYGINYQYGLFRQDIVDGYQRELPDYWSGRSSPWLIERSDEACLVPIYGRIEHTVDRGGEYNPMWLDWQLVVGVPYDMPIVGYGGRTVNYLRLFSARASHEFDIQIFNDGDYFKAVEQKINSENISKVLYPSDAIPVGKELRLLQEYFLVACAMRDITRRFLKQYDSFEHFSERVAIQINDTHPALIVAELMRFFVDEQLLPWETAWRLTQATLGYTNHTLMPEALETWPVPLMERLLPRHMQIINEINRRFLEAVSRRWPGDNARLEHMSCIEESTPKQVRMAHLAIVGSHAVNGVAALHTELIKTRLVPDFYAMWPERFTNKTNGVTPRRWLLKANPLLAELITESIGDGWPIHLEQLVGLTAHAADAAFQDRFRAVKRANKQKLADLIKDTCNVEVEVNSVFDVHVKRIHEYKRQLLNVLHIVWQYLRITEDRQALPVPKTYIFAGKAAPGYQMAKLIIKLITSIGQVINHDPQVDGQIKVVFIPDFRVSLAEKIIPAADLSEQISTAGTEASGTGNMKLALNGALTIGTLDGANIEICQEVGPENIYIFGLTAEEIVHRRPTYAPDAIYHGDESIRRVIDAMASQRFCPEEPGLFAPICRSLLAHGDTYFHLADFQAYVAAQADALEDYRDGSLWARKAIMNVARMGKFSSDRTIQEYARDIWGIRSIETREEHGTYQQQGPGH